MRKLLLVAALAAAPACSKTASKPAPAAASAPAVAAVAVPTVTVDQVAASLAKGEIQAVDANEAPTRQRMGVIPGAVLLSDSDTFKIAELPPDKTKALVFYCVNDACRASHHAAEKAIAAGYDHVRVMPAGIAGWVKAGEKTQQI